MIPTRLVSSEQCVNTCQSEVRANIFIVRDWCFLCQCIVKGVDKHQTQQQDSWIVINVLLIERGIP